MRGQTHLAKPRPSVETVKRCVPQRPNRLINIWLYLLDRKAIGETIPPLMVVGTIWLDWFLFRNGENVRTNLDMVIRRKNNEIKKICLHQY